MIRSAEDLAGELVSALRRAQAGDAVVSDPVKISWPIGGLVTGCEHVVHVSSAEGRRFRITVVDVT